MSEIENSQELDISQKLIECLKVSVIDTLSTMAMTETTIINTETADAFNLSFQIGGLIYLYGNHEGMIAISGDKSVIQFVISNIVYNPEGEMADDDIMDGVSELVNMIAGGMKSKAGLTTDAKLTPPIAIVGPSCKSQWKTFRPTYVTTFKTEAGNFQVHASV
ncbi:MAG: chemotaxis protein CheX [Magnetococcales bacterium]|nr:chemotaxis protein CheX [Magnetococcales bacterium]